MYLPDHFKMTDSAQIRAALDANPFASFATNGPQGPEVSHLPLEVSHLPLVVRDEGEAQVIYGHFARANPHWKTLDGNIPALAVFDGPHGYISPSYYATKGETGKVVPTWNYVIIHARGIPQALNPGDDSREAIDLLTDTMERPRADPWKVSDAPAPYTASMMRGIVVFRMVIDSLEAKAKLSQNKSTADIDGTCKGLSEDGEHALAETMRTANSIG